MNSLQEHLTNVAIAAIRQEAGNMIAHQQTEVSPMVIAESLEELLTALSELRSDTPRFKAACEYVYLITPHGIPKFIKKCAETADTASKSTIASGDTQHEISA